MWQTFKKTLAFCVVVIIAMLCVGASVTTVVKGVTFPSPLSKGANIYIRDTIIGDSDAFKSRALTSSAWKLHDWRLILIAGDSAWITFDGQRGRTASTRIPIRILVDETLKFVNTKMCSISVRTHTEAAQQTFLLDAWKYRD